jgi:hypothetical protein
MPHHLVADDLVHGMLVELHRRAWHMRPLRFMISQRRAYSCSACETQLIALLENRQTLPKDASQRSVSRRGTKA